MNEMDGKTHARVSNAVKRAKELNQQNIFTTFLFYATTRLGRTTFLTFKENVIK